jgi:hypothetical protein
MSGDFDAPRDEQTLRRRRRGASTGTKGDIIQIYRNTRRGRFARRDDRARSSSTRARVRGVSRANKLYARERHLAALDRRAVARVALRVVRVARVTRIRRPRTRRPSTLNHPRSARARGPR